LRFVLGALLIIWGLYTAVFYRRTAKWSAGFHRGAATMLPWLYRLPVARASTSEKVWRPLAVVIGLLITGVGVASMIITPPK
jgi:hypothetical protein